MPAARSSEAAQELPRHDPAAWRLPWQDEAWGRTGAQLAAGRLPHALLLTGLEGVGKHAFAYRLAMRLLCDESGAEDACGRCRACQQFVARTHPDFHAVTVPEGKSWIVVDQVRELADELRLSAQYGAWKIAVVDPADRMNRNSFNALLKTLEEPSESTILILVSAHPSRLAATIRSRCQRRHLAPPAREAGLDWLRGQGITGAESVLDLAGGAPLAAMALADSEALQARKPLIGDTLAWMAGRGDPIALAAGWAKLPMALATGWMQTVLHDLIRLRQLGPGAALVNADLARDLQSVAHRLDWHGLHRKLDELARMRALADAPLAPQLQWEAMMYSYSWEGRE